MLVDHLPDVKVLASGSSFFKPFNKLGAPLSGRQKVITLFPFAALEMKEIFGPMKTFELLSELLVYGTYPKVFTSQNISEKRDYLINLRNSFLFKDILELENIRNSRKLP
jgi:predicted AAA+ superfamily ATPase